MADILLIDDDVHLHNMISLLLSTHNLFSDEVFDGSDAIEHLENRDYKLVITDMHMPDLNGLEVIKHARAKNPDVKIIAISGGDFMQNRDLSLLHQARKIPDIRIFKKPFEHDEFVEAVKEAVETPPVVESRGFFKLSAFR